MAQNRCRTVAQSHLLGSNGPKVILVKQQWSGSKTMSKNNNGWDKEKALTTPKIVGRPKKK